MKKTMWKILGVVVCGGLCAATAMAGDQPSATAHQAKATEANTMRTTWPPETLAGKIMMVDPAQRLVVVKGPDGVPFDMVVTPATRIESGNQRLALKDLNQDQQKNVSVRFIPARAGDIARTIQITG